MPLSELYRLAKGKLDSNEINSSCAAGQSSTPENDFFELVWENGQISMQGQSCKARKIPTCRSLPSHSPRGRDKDEGFAIDTRMGKFGDLDAGLNEIPIPVPSGEADLSQDEDVLPWLNYTMDDPLQHEYSADFLHELSGATINELPASNNFTLLDKRNDSNQVFWDSQKNSARHVSSSEQGIISKGSLDGEDETPGTKASSSRLYLPTTSHKCQTSFASFRSRVSDITENNASNATQHAPCGEITQIPSASSDFFSLKMEKQDPIIPSSSSSIMNFSHFARPAAIVRANLQSLSSARSESMVTKNKGATATRHNPPELTFVDSSGECPKESTMHNQQVMEPSKADLKLLGPKYLEQNAVASKHSDPACKEDAAKIDQTSNQILGESGSKGQDAVDKIMEPAVASSSVCSGNGAERGLDDPTQNSKRKSRDTEDSEWHSEDVEDESVGVRQTAPARGGTGSKRSRAAEVHNLSERRRRDRINEKMRALQELIPNCNKVDKASMLDEAIEYLKTLQLQVQIMSMGAGLYMPPMMLPAGMQHMHAPHIPPFSPMGVGMQMGLGVGYGMGMPDINGGSSRFPVVQVPQMQGTHLPLAHMAGHTALHGMARPNPQAFGLPGQGLPMPIPCGPVFSFSGGPLMNSSARGLNACGTAGNMETVDSASASGLKDPMPNVNSQVVQSTSGCDSESQKMSTQCGATTVGFEQPALVQNSSHASEVNDSGAVNPGKEDDLLTGKSCHD